MAPTDDPPEPAADRFAQLDPTAADALRRLDARVRDVIPAEAYEDIVVDFLAGEVLTSRPARTPSGADSAAALLADLSGELLIEASRRQRNRPLRGSGPNRTGPPEIEP